MRIYDLTVTYLSRRPSYCFQITIKVNTSSKKLSGGHSLDPSSPRLDLLTLSHTPPHVLTLHSPNHISHR